MALTDSNSCDPVFDPASLRPNGVPHDALARLPGLRREAGRDLATAGFLARSPQACVILMLAGALALIAGGGSLKADFAWGSLVLIGVVAMTRNYIRGFARSLRRTPLAEAASDLRVLLLYTGAAWGTGAFLVMSDSPAPALAFAFAAAPSLALALVLRDGHGSVAFAAPATLFTAGAAILGAWPLDVWVAAAIMLAGTGIALVPLLRRADRVP